MAARGTVRFDEDICKGCGLCVDACPRNALAMDDSHINEKGYHPATLIHPDECIGCEICAVMCPDQGIEVDKYERAPRAAAQRPAAGPTHDAPSTTTKEDAR